MPLPTQVVPRLKAYARARGFEFAPATMRWGVTKAHANNHAHAELCIREVHACQEQSGAQARRVLGFTFNT